MWIMVAGPYTSGEASEELRRERLLEMNRAAFSVWQKGHIPIIGVNMALPVIEAAGPEWFTPLMMPISLALAERCDAILRIGGPSKGADQEVERFQRRSLPVYFDINDVPESDDSRDTR